MLRSIFTLLGASMLAVLTFFYLEVKQEEKEEEVYLEGSLITRESPPCLQMYYNIEKYSEKYGIPKNYAYGIAFKETRYVGPFQWSYVHSQESFAGAVGPMQVMPSTAKLMWKKTVPKKELRDDIRLNVETSMMLLRVLYDKYKDWKIVFGAYNTGRPMVNQYALDVYNYKVR